jgi:hypothetical protein
LNILVDLNIILDKLGARVETGVFSGIAPDEYIVITPLYERFDLFADNRPLADAQEARLSLFSKGNYVKRKNQIVKALMADCFVITSRQYIGHDTGYHHLAIDTAKNYRMEI